MDRELAQSAGGHSRGSSSKVWRTHDRHTHSILQKRALVTMVKGSRLGAGEVDCTS